MTVANPPAVNQPPVAVDDVAQTPRSTPVVIAVLLNDSDPDGTLVPSSVRFAVRAACMASGSSCKASSDCCSGRCNGKKNAMVCK